MPQVRLKIPRPHAAQQSILDNLRRFNVVNCGRRFGKTTLGVNRLVKALLAGKTCGWFAPTYKYLAEAWRDVVRILKPIIASKNKSEKRIEFITGGVLEFWSLEDPDSGRSRKYHLVIVDEAAKCRHLEAAWTEAILPTLADYRGEADFYSTPKGRNYFFTLAALGQDRHETDWAYFNRPTSSNPFIQAAEVLRFQRLLPERTFAQEILAEFLDDAGGVFRGVSRCVDKGRTAADKPARGLVYSQGSDLARKEDFTVNTILGPDGRQAFHDRFNQISWTRQVEAISQASRTFNRATVNLDSSGVGDPIYEALRKTDMGPIRPFVFTNASKGQLIDNLAIMIEQGRLRLMDIPEQTAELVAFEYEITKAGNVTMSAPDGLHDDTVIALALAAWGAGSARKYGFL